MKNISRESSCNKITQSDIDKLSSLCKFMLSGHSTISSGVSRSGSIKSLTTPRSINNGSNHIKQTIKPVVSCSSIKTARVVLVGDTIDFCLQADANYYYKVVVNKPITLKLSIKNGPSTNKYNPYISCEMIDGYEHYINSYDGILNGQILEFSVNNAGVYYWHFQQNSSHNTDMTVMIGLQQARKDYNDYSSPYSSLSRIR